MFVVNVGLGHGYYIPMEDLDTLVQNTIQAPSSMPIGERTLLYVRCDAYQEQARGTLQPEIH